MSQKIYLFALVSAVCCLVCLRISREHIVFTNLTLSKPVPRNDDSRAHFRVANSASPTDDINEAIKLVDQAGDSHVELIQRFAGYVKGRRQSDGVARLRSSKSLGAFLSQKKRKPCELTSTCATKFKEGRQNATLGILVPFRDRQDQLEVFATQMHVTLTRQGISYRMFVVEQPPNTPFNRGWLINIGFLVAEKECEYVALHDVDMIPLQGVDYRMRTGELQWAHLAVHPAQFTTPRHGKYCGGVLLVASQVFRQIRGFNPEFWGWGGEDDDFCIRLIESKWQDWPAAIRWAESRMMEEVRSPEGDSYASRCHPQLDAIP
ncbi:hypothetical protein CYMTET_28787 [Cymbomonas tetramitiformis]|uniref:Hexosyltransferase n=1 Tax=Cymbomonas tetramitiformis TaxID=36881 RepID=A0AAE0KVK1_9CHLO|nr:hypothetical protein CYMTET_28787 [Cymbomonas tetramitiformis]